MVLKLILIIVGLFVVGGMLVGAVEISFNPDSKLTKIYTDKICEAEISMLKESKFCNKDTLSEIDTDFQKDSKTGLTKYDYDGIKRSLQ